jgi:putative tryptophan/tyrosine transport system substrate-binding protein
MRRPSRKTALASLLFAGALLAFAGTAQAQQPGKVPRIGVLSTSTRSSLATRVNAFRQGLRELGYVEGKNIVIEDRYAEGKPARVNELAAELVRARVEVIVTGGPTATRSAKEATVTIPIVMANVPDPVGLGFVASLARPGGNLTGMTSGGPELSGKRLGLLKETVPKLSRVAILWNVTNPGSTEALKETEVAAPPLGLKLQSLELRTPDDFDSVFTAATKGHAEALLILGNPIADLHRARLATLATKSRLPAMYYASEFTEAGGLMSYAPNIAEQFHRAATYVDKILKGAKSADLPVEQPKKFEFIMNLKAAKQIGLTIPPNVLARADKVIR